MRIAFGLLALMLAACAIFYLQAHGGTTASAALPAPSRPELDYLKAVNSSGPPQDPQLLFLLMGAYANANLQGEGADFLSARLNEFSSRLADPQKALYLS